MSGPLVYQRYPLQMSHPGFQPAIISDDKSASQKFGDNGTARPGRAMMFPPVVVNNEDQEEQYKAKGYRSAGGSDPEAFATNQAAPGLLDHDPQQWPQWKDGILHQDPNGHADDKMWPMYVVPEGRERMDGVIVKNAVEYERVMGVPHAPTLAVKVESSEAAEMAEFRAWKAAQQKPPEMAPMPDHTSDETTADDDRTAALKLAEEMKIDVDKRWSTRRILDTLEAAASGP